MIRLRLSLTLIIGALPTLALASPETPQAALTAAPYTLHIETGCIGTVHVIGTAGLAEHADMRDVPRGLSFQTDAHDAWLTGSACQKDATIQLSAGSAVVSTASTFDTLTIEGVEGPVSLRQGRGDIVIDKATALLYRGSGPGDLSLNSLTGPAIFALSGPGDATVDTVTAPSLAIGTTGPGDVVIRGGMIDRLTITLSGPGEASFGGSAREATLQTDGPGDIRVHQVLKAEHAHSSASGAIEIAVPSGSGKQSNDPNARDVSRNGASVTDGEISLSDGTRLNAHRLINPDGSVLDFDALRHIASDATKSAPPLPPEPPQPPQISAKQNTIAQTAESPSSAKAAPESDDLFSFSFGDTNYTSGMIVLIVLAIVLMRRRLIPRIIAFLHARNPDLAKRAEPFLLSLMAKVSAPMPQTQLPQLLDLTQRLQKLDRRVGAVETCVTSRDFALHAQFRDLDRRHG